ncbi:MAG: hypothetical protein Q9M50_05490 [Methylococcales bacterium]|nr:hypothetical protein [Methylococcales bacterium]
MNSKNNYSKIKTIKISEMKKIKAAYIAAKKEGTIKTYIVQPVLLNF